MQRRWPTRSSRALVAPSAEQIPFSRQDAGCLLRQLGPARRRWRARFGRHRLIAARSEGTVAIAWPSKCLAARAPVCTSVHAIMRWVSWRASSPASHATRSAMATRRRSSSSHKLHDRTMSILKFRSFSCRSHVDCVSCIMARFVSHITRCQ